MAQGSPGAVHNRLIRCIAAAMRFIYFDVKIGLSNKFWARHLAETVAICRSATAHHLSGWRVANPETAANLVRYRRNGQGGLNASGIIAGVWKQTAFSRSYGVETENATAFRQWRSWLRGVDLNHRPLGYEPNRTTLSLIDSATPSPATAVQSALIERVLVPFWCPPGALQWSPSKRMQLSISMVRPRTIPLVDPRSRLQFANVQRCLYESSLNYGSKIPGGPDN
jgi:hypothetical protein